MFAIAFNKITVNIFLLLLIAFAFVASDWLYGSYASVVRNVMITYFILFLLVKAFTGAPIPMMGVSFPELGAFGIGFIITAVIVWFLPVGSVGELTSDTLRLAFGFGILHGFIKAYIEEAIFRGMLMKRIGIMLSNISFGFFHVGVIILTLTSMGLAVTFTAVAVPVLTLTALGFIWSFMAQRFGFMSAVGSHLAYNLKAFGVLGTVI